MHIKANDLYKNIKNEICIKTQCVFLCSLTAIFPYIDQETPLPKQFTLISYMWVVRYTGNLLKVYVIQVSMLMTASESTELLDLFISVPWTSVYLLKF